MARYDDDDRVVMIEREGNGLGAFLLGLAIGAGAALLLAPESGEAMRARLRREARRAGTRARELADDVGENLQDAAEKARRYADDVGSSVTDAASRARSEVGRRVDRARHAVGERARAAGDAIDAGRVAARQAREELDRAVEETKRAYAEARRERIVRDDAADERPPGAATE